MPRKYFNNLFQRVIHTLVTVNHEVTISGYQLAKRTWQRKQALRRNTRSVLFIILGILSAS